MPETRFRPATDADLPFLRDVYASTRYEELVPTGWPPEAIEAFLTDQFKLQHVYFQEHYPEAERLIILAGTTPIGRLYLARWDDEHRLMDIALVPDYRGRGIGGKLIREVLDEAAREGKPVRLHVEKFNRVRDYYLRLGFTVLDDRGVYDFMEWSSPSVD